MIDVETHVIDALATALETALSPAYPDAVVRRGPEVRGDGDARAELTFPTLALSWSDAVETPDVSIYKEIEIDADNVRVVWRRARLELPVDLWIYTATKTQRLDVLNKIREVLYPFIDGEPRDLWLELTDYYDARARYYSERPSNRDDQSASEGYATALIRVRAATSLLHHQDYEKHTWSVQTGA